MYSLIWICDLQILPRKEARHACGPNSQKAESGFPQVQGHLVLHRVPGQLGLHSNTLYKHFLEKLRFPSTLFNCKNNGYYSFINAGLRTEQTLLLYFAKLQSEVSEKMGQFDEIGELPSYALIICDTEFKSSK